MYVGWGITAKVSEEPKQSLIPPSGEVNVDDTTDKFLSMASIQPVTQLKSPTDLKTKKKKNPPSSKPKSPYKVRVILPKKQVTETQYTKDVIDITPKEAEERDDSESLSGLRSMPDDDLASMTGFETQDSVDHVSEEGTETLHASANKPAQSDPLGHLHEELCLLHNKINQIVASLLSDALKYTLLQLIKDSIESFILDSIAEELPQVEAHVQKNLQDQLPNILLKPIKNSSEEDTSGKKETDDEPLAKKLKFLIPSSSIPSPTPLKSIMPEPPKVTKAIKMTLD
nr:hypothetical protein [Tanacetum cinerariifolium]